VVLLACIYRSVAKPTLIHHDNAMYLQCAEMILEGKRPYVDFVDLNPPLVMFVSLPAAIVARLTGAPAAVCFNMFVIALLASSAWQIARLMRRAGTADAVPGEWPALVWVLASLVLLRSGDWGQREHLFVLLAGPAVVSAGLRVDGRLGQRERFALGLQLGLGALLKPHFMAVVALVELFHVRAAGIKRVLWSPYVAGLAVPGVAYAVYWLLCPAEVREAFFHRWVPMIRTGYAAYAHPLGATLVGFLGRKSTFALCLALAAVVALRSRLGAVRPLALLLVGVAGVSEVVAIQQRKGWSYHEIPFLIFGLTVAGIAALQLMRQRMSARVFARAATGLTIAIAGLVASTGTENPVMPAFAAAVRSHSRAGDAVLVLSSEVWPAYTALTVTDRRPGSRLLWLFPVPMLLSVGEKLDGPAFKQVATELLEDIDERHPRLVIVPTSNRIERPFIERYLRARLARDYVSAGPIDRDFELLELRR
jgi:hypothetical protein